MEQPWLDDEWQGRIDTPAALLDLDRLDANIGRMANAMRQRGMALRPHAKTHKSIQVARRQLAAGAVGLAVATIGEAEVFADAGVEDLFIAYPLFVRGPKSQRLRRLAESCQLSVGIDSVEGAATLSAIGGQVGLRVLIEVDAGGRRTGVLPEDAGGLARRAADLGLEVVGVFTHAGHSYGGPDRRGPAGEDELVGLGAAARSLQARGIEPEVISAGSTPTALLSARAPVTEERPGTYVFGDRQQLGLAGNLGDPAGTIALVVAATVVSHGARGGFVVDAGAKALAKDTAAYLSGHGEIVGYPNAVLTRVNDHHGLAEVPKGSRRPAVGEVVFIVPNHVCPVVNLADELLVVQRGAVVDRWRVDARGRNS